MKRVAGVALTLALGTWFIVAEGVADEAKELAAFKATAAHVNWLALSADGSRLAAATGGSKGEKNKAAAPGEAIAWDVEGQRQVCACKTPGADFTHLWLSADGKTVVTVDHGIAQFNVKEKLATIVAGKGAFQAWDAETGKPIGARISPKPGSGFVAAALSPDGRYFAAVWNERGVGPAGAGVSAVPHASNAAYTVGEVRVWDLRGQKVKWTLAGTPHTGQVTWLDALAFSPDGTRLAAYRSFDAMFSQAPAGGRDRDFKRLRMLTLDPAKDVPGVAVLDEGGVPHQAIVDWPGDGRTLSLRDGLSFESLDAVTGRIRETFQLSVGELQPAAPAVNAAQPRKAAAQPRLPNGMQLPPRPGPSRLPPPDTTAEEAPQNYFIARTALSADGSRFAAFLMVAREAKHVIANRVVVWDAGKRQVLGTVRLPDEPYVASKVKGPQSWKEDANGRSRALALSGDGRRLAVADPAEVVHVYDVTTLGGGK